MRKTWIYVSKILQRFCRSRGLAYIRVLLYVDRHVSKQKRRTLMVGRQRQAAQQVGRQACAQVHKKVSRQAGGYVDRQVVRQTRRWLKRQIGWSVDRYAGDMEDWPSWEVTVGRLVGRQTGRWTGRQACSHKGGYQALKEVRAYTGRWGGRQQQKLIIMEHTNDDNNNTSNNHNNN